MAYGIGPLQPRTRRSMARASAPTWGPQPQYTAPPDPNDERIKLLMASGNFDPYVDRLQNQALRSDYAPGVLPLYPGMMDAAGATGPRPGASDVVKAHASIDQASRIGQEMQKNRMSAQFDQSQAMRTQARIGQDDAHRARLALMTGPYSQNADTTAAYDKFRVTEDFLTGRAQQGGGNAPGTGVSSVRGPTQVVPSGQGQTLQQRFGNGVIPRSVGPAFNEGGGVVTLTPEKEAELRAAQMEFLAPSGGKRSRRGQRTENFQQYGARKEDEAQQIQERETLLAAQQPQVVYDKAGKAVAVSQGGKATPLSGTGTQAGPELADFRKAQTDQIYAGMGRNTMTDVETVELEGLAKSLGTLMRPEERVAILARIDAIKAIAAARQKKSVDNSSPPAQNEAYGQYSSATEAAEASRENFQAPPSDYPDARQAADGKWYAPDPNRPGKYLLVK